jgi:hypothetical protein
MKCYQAVKGEVRGYYNVDLRYDENNVLDAQGPKRMVILSCMDSLLKELLKL